MPAMKEGDWICGDCDNHNFASRQVCNRCQAPKEAPRPPPSRREFGGSPGGGRGAPEMKDGDWICSECSNHNFASREVCNRCHAPKRPPPGPSGGQMMQGDWICSTCGNHNFAKREACNKCGDPKPRGLPPKGSGKGGYGKAAEPMRSFSAPPPQYAAPPARRGPPPMDDRRDFREGDWTCPECGNHNFASRESCNRCGEHKAPPARYGAPARPTSARPSPYDRPPQHAARPSPYDRSSPRGPPLLAARAPMPSQGKGGKAMRDGDWICSGCSNHNFASRENCNRCNMPKNPPANFRPGDWVCIDCKNHNFASKSACNRCGAPKP
eukprot:TRINITY_DN73526_c0_g1_i1.p1 TRINITY_DN73526_c0_g1~~TRINITY_DN73526_c0_g1_i1.p1  ORF type:complete len:341 (+),score=42.21 TRINITY_DN73526_c0_g1_i1:49-1023(+)